MTQHEHVYVLQTFADGNLGGGGWYVCSKCGEPKGGRENVPAPILHQLSPLSPASGAMTNGR